MGHGYAKCPQNLSIEQQLDLAAGMPKVKSVNFFGIVLQCHLTCKMAL